MLIEIDKNKAIILLYVLKKFSAYKINLLMHNILDKLI